jgi:hypothetical protein
MIAVEPPLGLPLCADGVGLASDPVEDCHYVFLV